jgi:acyl transferase domain-containing protein
VISGDLDAMEKLLDDLKASEIPVRAIGGPAGAGHSHQVEPLREQLLDAFAAVRPRTGEVPFYSTVTAGALDTTMLGAEYWYRNARETVQFEPTVRALLERGHRAFIEISPHPTLVTALIEATEQALSQPASTALIGTLRRNDGGAARFLSSLAELWVGGATVDWSAILTGAPAQRVPLPPYSFQRQRYWHEPAASRRYSPATSRCKVTPGWVSTQSWVIRWCLPVCS